MFNKPLVGIEPTIYCLEGSRLIHWATGAIVFHEQLTKIMRINLVHN